MFSLIIGGLVLLIPYWIISEGISDFLYPSPPPKVRRWNAARNRILKDWE